MKRATLADRAQFLFDKQDAVARAAHDFAKAEGNSLATAYTREMARRGLYQAALALGVAMKRYLGGST